MSQSESEWTQESLVPLLRKLGFLRVVYVHGVLEAGRDVIFADLDRFGLLHYYAAQVKVGSISARSETGEVQSILMNRGGIPGGSKS